MTSSVQPLGERAARDQLDEFEMTTQPYVRSRLESGTSPGTINRDPAVVRRF